MSPVAAGRVVSSSSSKRKVSDLKLKEGPGDESTNLLRYRVTVR